MAEKRTTPDELFAELQKQLAEMGPGAVNEWAGHMLSALQTSGPVAGRMQRRRPHLRRPPLDTRKTYRVRVDLDYAKPPIWRRLDLPSDLTLSALHEVLQIAYGWYDAHLHRFALGGSPFDLTSELFLCEYDAEQGDDDGTPDRDVRLDECLQQPGDKLRYTYDYGDSWDLTIRLESVRDDELDAPVCLDGRRAGPPEDCGGLRTAQELAEVLEDPAAFEVAEVNEALRSPLGSLDEWLSVFAPRVQGLLLRALPSRLGEVLAARAQVVARQVPPLATLPEEEIGEALRAHLWFLDQASGEGLPLTSAGYLKPESVVAAAELIPSMASWIGKNNREVQTRPVLVFRETLRSLGLLRKYKGRLLLTRAGAAVRGRPRELAEFLVRTLAKCLEVDGATGDLDLLVLLWLASSAGEELDRSAIVELMESVGWRRADERPLEWWDLPDGVAEPLLANVRLRPEGWRDKTVSRVAAAIAREAVLTR